MKARINRTLALNPQQDILDTFEVRVGESPVVGANGAYTSHSRDEIIPQRVGFSTSFQNLPIVSASYAATAHVDEHLVGIGTGTEVIGRSTYGGVLLTTGASANDTSGLVGVTLKASRTLINAASLVAFRTKLRMASIAAVLVSAGVQTTIADADVNPTTNAGDGATFFFDPGAIITTGLPAASLANWIAHAKIGGADTYIDTGVAVIAATDYLLTIMFNASRIPLFYINGVLVATNVLAMTDAITPYAVLGVQTGTAAAKTVDIHSVSMSRETA